MTKPKPKTEHKPLGRKPLPEGEAMVPVTLKMKPAQHDKMKRLGGAAWVRERIDKAREPNT